MLGCHRHPEASLPTSEKLGWGGRVCHLHSCCEFKQNSVSKISNTVQAECVIYAPKCWPRPLSNAKVYLSAEMVGFEQTLGYWGLSRSRRRWQGMWASCSRPAGQMERWARFVGVRRDRLGAASGACPWVWSEGIPGLPHYPPLQAPFHMRGLGAVSCGSLRPSYTLIHGRDPNTPSSFAAPQVQLVRLGH